MSLIAARISVGYGSESVTVPVHLQIKSQDVVVFHTPSRASENVTDPVLLL